MNRKKIVIVSCVSPPETVVLGRVNWDIAERFAQQGHSVTFISPLPSRPLGKFSNELTFSKVSESGVNHIRINSYVHPHSGFWGRVRESVSFSLNANKMLNTLVGDVDLLYCMPWPFLGQLLILLKAKANNITIVMNVQDLYPESLLNKINYNLIRKLLSPLKLIDKFIAHKSDHITVVSDSLRQVYIDSRGVAACNVTVVENWQDELPFINYTQAPNLYAKYGLSGLCGKRIFLYLGNIGPVAGLEEVIRGFSESGLTSLALVIAGSGTSKHACEILVQELNLPNVHFVEIGIGLVSVVELQSLASICILPTVSGAAASSIPSKMIAYMFSKKPILTSADRGSFTTHVIENNCGWIVDGSTGWGPAFVYAASISDDELTRLGEVGFEYAIKNYSKSVGLNKIELLFRNLTEIKK